MAAFNWRFVPPPRNLAVDTREHALLLASMLAVGLLVVTLVRRLRRRNPRRRQRAARREALLRAWGDDLRDADDPRCWPGGWPNGWASSRSPWPWCSAPTAPTARQAAIHRLGDPGADALAGLAHCWLQGQPLGRGGRHEEQPDLYLPGAAVAGRSVRPCCWRGATSGRDASPDRAGAV